MKQHPDQRPRDLVAARQALVDALLTIDRPGVMRAFLDDLCTPAELEAMIDRWWAARLLAAGGTYRAVSDTTGVSMATISRVARCLDQGTGGYRAALQQLETNTTS